MNAITALARLRRLGKPVVTTEDAALALRITRSAASRTLARLAGQGLIQRVRHGLWMTGLQDADPLLLPDYLTSPFPSYVSFQSALYLHGMISQVPHVMFIASLARTRQVKTVLGTFSIHRLAPRFFGGYVTTSAGVRLATPEKALLDTLYLVPTRSRLFADLPEIELPRTFDRVTARRWAVSIRNGPRRWAVVQRLDELLRGKRSARPQTRATGKHRRAGQWETTRSKRGGTRRRRVG